jgi:hypothetical protein
VLRSSLLVLVLLFAPSLAEAACSDGSTCFCDTLTHPGGDNIVWCEDFDDLSWDEPTGTVWDSVAGYRSQGSPTGVCLQGTTPGVAGEGTSNDHFCYDFVQNDTCNVSGETECALGNQSLGQKYNIGFTHGIFMEYDLGQTLQDFGITVLVKYSDNFDTVGNDNGFKNDEWLTDEVPGAIDQPTGFHFGQDVSSFWDCHANKEQDAGGTGLMSGVGPGDRNWEVKMFLDDLNGIGECSSDANWSSVTVSKGRACCTNAKVVHWSPYSSDFEGGSFDWNDGEWGCLKTKIIGAGTASMSVQQWWRGERDTTETEVFNMSGLDTTGSYFEGMNGIAFNNFYNGGNGFDSGYCTDSPGGGNHSPPCPDAYRYQDNMIVTDGEPITCAVAMAEILGSPPATGGTSLSGGSISGGSIR